MAYRYPYEEEEKRYERPKLPTNRNPWKVYLLSLLTCGIYSVGFFMPIADDLDKIAPTRYRTKTLNYIFALILAYFTYGIVLDVWLHQISERIEEALNRRRISYEFGTGDFWRWYLFGSLILVGPIVYMHKFCRAMNLLCEDYNERPELE